MRSTRSTSSKPAASSRIISMIMAVFMFAIVSSMPVYGTYETSGVPASGGSCGNKLAKATNSGEYQGPPDPNYTGTKCFFVANDISTIDEDKLPEGVTLADVTPMEFSDFTGQVSSGNTYFFNDEIFQFNGAFSFAGGDIRIIGSESGNTVFSQTGGPETAFAFGGDNVYISGVAFSMENSMSSIVALQQGTNISVVDCMFQNDGGDQTTVNSVLNIMSQGPVHLEKITIDGSVKSAGGDNGKYCVNLNATNGSIEAHMSGINNKGSHTADIGLASAAGYDVFVYLGDGVDSFGFSNTDRPGTGSEYQVPWKYVNYPKNGSLYSFSDIMATSLGDPCYDIRDGSWVVSNLDQLISMQKIISEGPVTIKTSLKFDDDLIAAINDFTTATGADVNLVLANDLGVEIDTVTGPAFSSAPSLTASFTGTVHLHGVDFKPTNLTYDNIENIIGADSMNHCKFTALPKELESPDDPAVYEIVAPETVKQLPDPIITKLYSKTGVEEPALSLFSDITDWTWSLPDSADGDYISLDSNGLVTVLKRPATGEYISTVRCEPKDTDDLYGLNNLKDKIPYVEYQVVIKADAKKLVTVDYYNEGKHIYNVDTEANTPVGSARWPSDPTTTESGKYFSGWFTANGVEYTANTIIVEDTKLYASWSQDLLRVNFYDQITPDLYATLRVSYGNTGGSSWPADPGPREGYTFGGWFTSVDGTGTQYYASTPIRTDVDLYAHWIPVEQGFPIYFDVEGQIYDQADVPGPGQQAISWPTDPTRSGYTFEGWYEHANGVGKKYTRSDTFDSTMTLYASWTKQASSTPDSKPEPPSSSSPDSTPEPYPSRDPDREHSSSSPDSMPEPYPSRDPDREYSSRRSSGTYQRDTDRSSTVTIADESAPLASPDELITIEDEDVPLTVPPSNGNPPTGGHRPYGQVAVLLLSAAVILFAGKKSRFK